MLVKETKEEFRRIESSHKDPVFMITKNVLLSTIIHLCVTINIQLYLSLTV